MTSWKPNLLDILFLTIGILITSPNPVVPPHSRKRILTRTCHKTISISISIIPPPTISTPPPPPRNLRRISKPRYPQARLHRLKRISTRILTPSPTPTPLVFLLLNTTCLLVPEVQISMTTTIMRFPCWFQFGNEILSEFSATLVYCYAVADYFCCTTCCVREFGTFHECVFETGDAVYCVEEAEETDTRPTLDLSALFFAVGMHVIGLTDERGERKSPGKQTCNSLGIFFESSPFR